MIYLFFIILLNFIPISCTKNKTQYKKSVINNTVDPREVEGSSLNIKKNKCNNLKKAKSVSDVEHIIDNKKNQSFSSAAKKFMSLTRTKSDNTQITIEGRPLTLSASQIKVYNEKDPTPDNLKLNKTQKSEKATKDKDNEAEEDTLRNVDTLDDDDSSVTKADKEKAKASISTDVITVFPELYK